MDVTTTMWNDEDNSTTWGDEKSIEVVSSLRLMPNIARQLGLINRNTERLIHGQPLFVNVVDAFPSYFRFWLYSGDSLPKELKRIIFKYYCKVTSINFY